MPYIKQHKRDAIEKHSMRPENAGELNYSITRMCHSYIKNHIFCYATLNEVVGVLECAKAELLRTVVGSYENKKRAENGPVSELDDDSHERMR